MVVPQAAERKDGSRIGPSRPATECQPTFQAYFTECVSGNPISVVSSSQSRSPANPTPIAPLWACHPSQGWRLARIGVHRAPYAADPYCSALLFQSDHSCGPARGQYKLPSRRDLVQRLDRSRSSNPRSPTRVESFRPGGHSQPVRSR